MKFELQFNFFTPKEKLSKRAFQAPALRLVVCPDSKELTVVGKESQPKNKQCSSSAYVWRFDAFRNK